MNSHSRNGRQRGSRLQTSKLLSLLVIFVYLLLACIHSLADLTGQSSTASPTPTVIIKVQEATGTHPVPTPVICTPLPPGMTLIVRPVSSLMAHLEVNGLKPGEKLIIIAHVENAGYSSQIEIHPLIGADQNGQYVDDMRGLNPLRGNTENRWEIQVVHSRGVVCESVTLP